MSFVVYFKEYRLGRTFEVTFSYLSLNRFAFRISLMVVRWNFVLLCTVMSLGKLFLLCRKFHLSLMRLSAVCEKQATQTMKSICQGRLKSRNKSQEFPRIICTISDHRMRWSSLDKAEGLILHHRYIFFIGYATKRAVPSIKRLMNLFFRMIV